VVQATALGAGRSDANLTGQVRRIHERSRGTYGVPRVHAELAYTGTRCSRKRVARLMREAGLEGVAEHGHGVAGVLVVRAGVLPVPTGGLVFMASRRGRSGGLFEVLGPLGNVLLMVLVVVHVLTCSVAGQWLGWNGQLQSAN